ncbi:adenylyltransferase/cytidyltransferase family protein [Candidatus Falkowbacteria bacterium]|nr:adenylyltransferase/cytidyltransferase family protein [Candidatus Falkowbacteria bacterium]
MAKPEKKVMVFGTFSVLHPGHLYFFKKAKERGDKLIVVVARDATVRKVKGFSPKLDERARREMVSAIKSVNEAVFGDKFDWYKIILKYKPEIICLGYDQAVPKNFPAELKKRGVDAKIFRLKSYKPKKYKSSLITWNLKHKT